MQDLFNNNLHKIEKTLSLRLVFSSKPGINRVYNRNYKLYECALHRSPIIAAQLFDTHLILAEALRLLFCYIFLLCFP